MKYFFIILLFFSANSRAACNNDALLVSLIGDANEQGIILATRLISEITQNTDDANRLRNIFNANESELSQAFLNKLSSLKPARREEILQSLRALPENGVGFRLDDFYSSGVTNSPELRGFMLKLMGDHLRQTQPGYARMIKKLLKKQDNETLVRQNQIRSFDEINLSKSDNFRPPSLEGASGHQRMRERFSGLDENFQRAYLASYNSLNDNEQIGLYLEDLYTEAYAWQVRAAAGRTNHYSEALADGGIHPQALAAVVVKRLKARGDNNFVTVNRDNSISSGVIDQGAGFVSADLFDSVVKRSFTRPEHVTKIIGGATGN